LPRSDANKPESEERTPFVSMYARPFPDFILAKSGGVATEPTLDPESEESVDVVLGAGDHELPYAVDGVSTLASDIGRGEQNMRGVGCSERIIVGSGLSGRGA